MNSKSIPRALLSMRDLTQLLRRSRSSLNAMMKEGTFPSGFKIGRSRRWSSDEIDDYLRQLREGGAS